MNKARQSKQVVLVDGEDQEVGEMEVLEAHRGEGVQHRAVSVLMFDGGGRVLLQKRSKKKLLWPGCWSNTVCTHPQKSEGYLECAVRRLGEELGVEVDESGMKVVDRFYYRVKFNDEWSENELDTVLDGKYVGEVDPDRNEVEDWKWVEWGVLREEMEKKPEEYTPWFKIIVARRKDG